MKKLTVCSVAALAISICLSPIAQANSSQLESFRDYEIESILTRAEESIIPGSEREVCDQWMVSRLKKEQTKTLIKGVLKNGAVIGAGIALSRLGFWISVGGSVGYGLGTYIVHAKNPFLNFPKNDYQSLGNLLMLSRIETASPMDLAILINRYQSLIHKDQEAVRNALLNEGDAQIPDAMLKYFPAQAKVQTETSQAVLFRRFLAATAHYDQRPSGLCAVDKNGKMKSEHNSREWTKIFWNCGVASILFAKAPGVSAEMIADTYQSAEVGQCAMALLSKKDESPVAPN